VSRRPLIAILFTALAVATACSDDGSGSGAGNTDGVQVDPSTGLTLGPTTTFMPTCEQMPTPADLSAIVGIPLDLGIVIATGTCEYRGVNDQTRVVTLGLLTDPADQASFRDFLTSVGTTTPLTDTAVAGATLGPDNTVFVFANDAVYTVQTNVNDSPMSEQVPLSVAVLTKWLKL